MVRAVASPGNEARGHNINFSSSPLPWISFGFRDCFNLRDFSVFLAQDSRKCNRPKCFSLVIFEIFTVKMAAAV